MTHGSELTLKLSPACTETSETANGHRAGFDPLNWLSRLGKAWRHRRALNQLGTLDIHALDDIGLTQGDIARARRLDRHDEAFRLLNGLRESRADTALRGRRRA